MALIRLQIRKLMRAFYYDSLRHVLNKDFLARLKSLEAIANSLINFGLKVTPLLDNKNLLLDYFHVAIEATFEELVPLEIVHLLDFIEAIVVSLDVLDEALSQLALAFQLFSL